ncbi:MAG: hypothetical protein QNJ14_05880 [Woeseiaceae bacterium]|nr:hypothetical protein [Woeseiaceae bacterium]
MVGRPDAPKQGNTAGSLALLVLTSVFAVPVLAAPDHDILCDDHHEATLEISPSQLSATTVSHDPSTVDSDDSAETVSADRLLKPRFDATVREIFSDDEVEEDAEEVEVEAEDPAALRIRVPGVSDEDLVRFKRKMYRRDI